MCLNVLQLMEEMRNFLVKVFKLYLKQRSGIVLPLRQDSIQGRVLQNTTGLIRVGKVFFYPGLFIFIYLFILGISMDLKRPGGYSKSATYTKTILF